MTREIKFRAWDKELKEMFYSCDTFLNEFVEFHWHKCLMQFTGLYDKNGKEIYEGDILQDNEKKLSPFLIKWLGGHRGYSYFNSSEGNIFEVIGNEFENPELLEKKEHD